MTKSPIAQHFDKIAPRYDSYKRPSNLYYKTLKAVIQRLTKPQSRVLDIGCGTGEILSSVRPKRGVGIDISHQMIAIAKSKYQSRASLSFYQHDIEKKPFKGEYDYILFNDVIEHLLDPFIAIKNIASMMKKNTTLVFSMANPSWELFLLLLERLHLKMPEGMHYRISEETLMQLITDNDLRISTKHIYFPSIPLPMLNQFGLIYVYTIQKNME